MPGLELSKYRFVLQPLDPLYLPEYKGSTFRGGFGNIFRRVACACGVGVTVHHRSCLYAQVFETPASDVLPALPRTAHLPHPFVLEPPLDVQRVYMPGDRLAVHLVVIGQAIDWLPYCVFAFDELARVAWGSDDDRTGEIAGQQSHGPPLTGPIERLSSRGCLGACPRRPGVSVARGGQNLEGRALKYSLPFATLSGSPLTNKGKSPEARRSAPDPGPKSRQGSCLRGTMEV